MDEWFLAFKQQGSFTQIIFFGDKTYKLDSQYKTRQQNKPSYNKTLSMVYTTTSNNTIYNFNSKTVFYLFSTIKKSTLIKNMNKNRKDDCINKILMYIDHYFKTT